MALSVPLSRFTSRVGGGSAFYVRRHRARDMSIPKKVTLIVGLVTCAIVALFPPRKYSHGDYNVDLTPSSCFVFSSRFQRFEPNPPNRWYVVESDEARLIAELTLIVSITGVVFLLQKEKKP